jgi:hypothetical protein
MTLDNAQYNQCDTYEDDCACMKPYVDVDAPSTNLADAYPPTSDGDAAPASPYNNPMNVAVAYADGDCVLCITHDPNKDRMVIQSNGPVDFTMLVDEFLSIPLTLGVFND